MLKRLHENRPLQLGLGLLIGIGFGFLLQRGAVTRYEVIMGQLLFRDWTVAKVILTAIITGMIGIYTLRSLNLARLSIKPGAVGSTILGGLVFGAGFGLLGYCPGTTAGAVGQGSLDALLGGIPGMLIGGALYARSHDFLDRHLRHRGEFGDITLPDWLGVRPEPVVILVCSLLMAFMVGLELGGY
ncbi:MAG: YeeE/YedE thiosulfate transporter family protein [Desulfobacterales bacterium]